MSFQFTLQKVKELKEREKNNGRTEYNEAVQSFEAIATQLYNMLKRKEEIEQLARERMIQGTSIQQLQQKERELNRLHEEIIFLQRKTEHARAKMNKKQQQLMDLSIEYKKYEKLKELKKEAYDEENRRSERIQMDELSNRLFTTKRNWVNE